MIWGELHILRPKKPGSFDPRQSEIERITQNALFDSQGVSNMNPLLQWPVLLFIGMTLAFGAVLLGVSIGDARRG